MWTTKELLLWAFTQQTSPPLDTSTRMHMLRQHVELGHVSSPFCPTFDMVAEYMTKATPKPTHECPRGNRSEQPHPSDARSRIRWCAAQSARKLAVAHLCIRQG